MAVSIMQMRKKSHCETSRMKNSLFKLHRKQWQFKIISTFSALALFDYFHPGYQHFATQFPLIPASRKWSWSMECSFEFCFCISYYVTAVFRIMWLLLFSIVLKAVRIIWRHERHYEVMISPPIRTALPIVEAFFWHLFFKNLLNRLFMTFLSSFCCLFFKNKLNFRMLN